MATPMTWLMSASVMALTATISVVTPNDVTSTISLALRTRDCSDNHINLPLLPGTHSLRAFAVGLISVSRQSTQRLEVIAHHVLGGYAMLRIPVPRVPCLQSI